MAEDTIQSREAVYQYNEIPGKETEAGVVKVRRLSFGDKSDLVDYIVQVGTTGANIKFGQLRVAAIVFGVTEAPFFGKEEGPLKPNWNMGMTALQVKNRTYLARNLDEPTGRWIFEKVLEINPGIIEGLTPQKKGLAEPSSQADEPIQEPVAQ